MCKKDLRAFNVFRVAEKPGIPWSQIVGLRHYESYEEGLDDPTETTLRITPVVVGSEKSVTKVDDMVVM